MLCYSCCGLIEILADDTRLNAIGIQNRTMEKTKNSVIHRLLIEFLAIWSFSRTCCRFHYFSSHHIPKLCSCIDCDSLDRGEVCMNVALASEKCHIVQQTNINFGPVKIVFKVTGSKVACAPNRAKSQRDKWVNDSRRSKYYFCSRCEIDATTELRCGKRKRGEEWEKKWRKGRGGCDERERASTKWILKYVSDITGVSVK